MAGCSQASPIPPDRGQKIEKIESETDDFCDRERRCRIGSMQTFEGIPKVTVTEALRTPDGKDVMLRGFLSTDVELVGLIVPRTTPEERDESIPISGIPSTDELMPCKGVGVELHGIVGAIPTVRFGERRGIARVLAIRGIECTSHNTTPK